jgi:hypothetical protein
MAPRTRLPLAALALAALAAPAAAEWKFCAPEGGHCQCFGEMRYGHPGQAEHHANGGAYFKEHPEVTKWTSRDASGLQEGCGLSHFGGVDPFPALGNAKFCECNVPEEVVWTPCAGPGEVCDCASASLGSPPADADSTDSPIWAPEQRAATLGKRGAPSHAVVRATDDAGGYYGVASVDGEFTCPDDYPGARCECLVPAPAPRMAWQWCANDGGHCACTTSMRFGSTGTREQYDSGYFAYAPGGEKVGREGLGEPRARRGWDEQVRRRILRRRGPVPGRERQDLPVHDARAREGAGQRLGVALVRQRGRAVLVLNRRAVREHRSARTVRPLETTSSRRIRR